MGHSSRWAAILVVVALALYALGAHAWLIHARAPFRVTLSGSESGWQATAVASRRDGVELDVELALARKRGLPAAFVWELGLPRQGLTCRGLASFKGRRPAQVGVAPCRARWTATSQAFLHDSRAAWVALVWYDHGLHELRVPLAPAAAGPTPPAADSR